MSKYEILFKVIEILLQIVLVIFAWLALSAWKKELRGKDNYKLAKELLEYIKGLRFLVHGNTGSFHQIYINDILINKEEFYNDQLSLIKKDIACFDQSVFGLFSHINVRGDIFLPKNVKSILEDLYPGSGKPISLNKKEKTYIQLFGVKQVEITGIDECSGSMDGIYLINNTQITIEEYFKKWEKLITELQKII